MSAPLLTDEQMRVLKRQIDMAPKRWPFALANELEYARAVESATRAPLLAEIERLTAERDAAMADAERLNWVQKNAVFTEEDRDLDGSSIWVVAHSEGVHSGPTLRSAIDAARNAT